MQCYNENNIKEMIFSVWFLTVEFAFLQTYLIISTKIKSNKYTVILFLQARYKYSHIWVETYINILIIKLVRTKDNSVWITCNHSLMFQERVKLIRALETVWILCQTHTQCLTDQKPKCCISFHLLVNLILFKKCMVDAVLMPNSSNIKLLIAL